VIKQDEMKLLQGPPRPLAQKKFATRMLTRDLFRVANLLVTSAPEKLSGVNDSLTYLEFKQDIVG